MAKAEDAWDEWRRITRFLESARLAFDREADLWGSLQIADDTQISVSTGKGIFEVDVGTHRAAVGDVETLFASVLIHSYALAESAASDHLGRDSRSFGGIEDWGGRLLKAAGSEWEKVMDGEVGAVEVAVVRDAFAHGAREVDARAAARLAKLGLKSRPSGSRVSLDYETLQEYRARLRSLLRSGGIRR